MAGRDALEREGELWALRYQGEVFRLRDSKGLRYLAELLSHPGREFHVLDLARPAPAPPGRGSPAGAAHGDAGSAGPLLDPEAKAAYRARIRALDDEIDEAESFNDPERAERAAGEREAISRELARALGLGGRDRQAGAAAERARQAVRQAIRAALDRIADHAPALAERLAGEVRTGTFCSYVPAGGPALVVGSARGAGVPNNLPQRLTTFVGRETDLAEVAKLLEATRLLTLIGTGGAGKTRLAIETAAAHLDLFPDGAWFVDLAPLSDPALVPLAAARALGVSDEAARPVAQLVAGRLRDRDLLIVLDNCEHVLGAAGAFAAAVLDAAPAVRILATSREALGIGAETVWRVPSLDVPADPEGRPPEELASFAAVRLFADRATRFEPAFALDGDVAIAVARICRRLDGIPLAIELAAGRMNVLGPGEIAERLEDRLALLAGDGRDVPRHRTLRAAIEWSHDLLAPAERTLFHRLSVFAGGCSPEAAENVCAGDGLDRGSVLDLLGALVAKSLVIKEPVAGRSRLRMLETIRAYAGERLLEAGEEEAMRRQHAEWFLSLAERARDEMEGPAQSMWLSMLGDDHANLRAAVALYAARGPAESALRVGAAIWRYLVARGHLREGRRWLEEALAAAPGAPPALRAFAHLGLGSLTLALGDDLVARESHERSIALYREIDDVAGLVRALNNYGTMAHSRGDPELARARYEEALAIEREIGDEPAIAHTLTNLASLARAAGDFGEARALLDEALAIKRRVGGHDAVSTALNNAGNVALDQGDYRGARALFTEALAIRQELGAKSHIAVSLLNIGSVVFAEEDFDAARELFSQGLAIFRELEHRQGIGLALIRSASAAHAQGDHASARAAYEEASALFAALGIRGEVAGALCGLARVSLDEGDVDSARARLGDALAIYREPADPGGTADCLVSLARIALQRGLAAEAARLLGAVAALRDALPSTLSPPERADAERAAAEARARLGPEAFGPAEAEGAALALEDAIALGRTLL